MACTGEFLNSLRSSRAVKANGPFENDIPSIFQHILFGEPTHRIDSEDDRRDLTIGGVLLPEEQVYFERKNDNFVSVDWRYRDSKTRYRVSQPIMCQYYQNQFARGSQSLHERRQNCR